VLPADVSADPEYRARFNREADLASTLRHPHIVSVHDRGEYNGQLWISMDYVDGLDASAGMSPAQATTAVACSLMYDLPMSWPGPATSGSKPGERTNP
jgi:serine/threonine protein kinase